MPRTQRCSTTTAAFAVDYERHLADFCGLAFNSRKLHLRVIRNLLATRFPSGHIRWHELQFSDLAEFLKKEFRRLPNHWTQRVWLMAVRRSSAISHPKGTSRTAGKMGCPNESTGDRPVCRDSFPKKRSKRCGTLARARRIVMPATGRCCWCLRAWAFASKKSRGSP